MGIWLFCILSVQGILLETNPSVFGIYITRICQKKIFEKAFSGWYKTDVILVRYQNVFRTNS